jgi:hypothetical protein
MPRFADAKDPIPAERHGRVLLRLAKPRDDGIQCNRFFRPT